MSIGGACQSNQDDVPEFNSRIELDGLPVRIDFIQSFRVHGFCLVKALLVCDNILTISGT